ALSLKESRGQRLLTRAAQAFGIQPKTFAEQVLRRVLAERTERGQKRVKEIDWELFDRGVEAYTWFCLEEVVKAADAIALRSSAEHGHESERFMAEAVKGQLGKQSDASASGPFAPMVDDLKKSFAAQVFLWPRQSGPKGDLVDDEFGRVLQVPGWSNIFTQ